MFCQVFLFQGEEELMFCQVFSFSGVGGWQGEIMFCQLFSFSGGGDGFLCETIALT